MDDKKIKQSCKSMNRSGHGETKEGNYARRRTMKRRASRLAI